MPKVSRSRVVAASPERVWRLVGDPEHLPRWWPRTVRVEDVRGSGRGSRWTTVLETDRGRPVRADFRCLSAARSERYVWEQEVEGTPFERILRSSRLDVALEGEGERTTVRLTSDESLRGLSRLGSPMMRAAARRRLDDALDRIDLAVAGGPS